MVWSESSAQVTPDPQVPPPQTEVGLSRGALMARPPAETTTNKTDADVNAHLQPLVRDLLQNVVARRFGDRLTVPEQAAQSLHAPAALPPDHFARLVHTYARTSVMEQLDPSPLVVREVRDHLPDIFAELPHIDQLPPHNELRDLFAAYQTEPIALRNPVTIGQLHDHLTNTSATTPEIGLDAFQTNSGNPDDKTYLLRVGIPEELDQGPAWNFVQRFAGVRLHTHPNPRHLVSQRYPSLEDLIADGYHHSPSHIATPHGITAYSAPFDAETHYRRFVEAADPQRTSLEEYIEFAKQFGRCQVRSWDKFDSEQTLLEAVRQIQPLRS